MGSKEGMMKKRMLGSVWIVSLVLSCMLAACNNKSEVSHLLHRKPPVVRLPLRQLSRQPEIMWLLGESPSPSKALTEMEADGTTQAIYQRWFLAKR